MSRQPHDQCLSDRHFFDGNRHEQTEKFTAFVPLEADKSATILLFFMNYFKSLLSFSPLLCRFLCVRDTCLDYNIVVYAVTGQLLAKYKVTTDLIYLQTLGPIPRCCCDYYSIGTRHWLSSITKQKKHIDIPTQNIALSRTQTSMLCPFSWMHAPYSAHSAMHLHPTSLITHSLGIRQLFGRFEGSVVAMLHIFGSEQLRLEG